MKNPGRALSWMLVAGLLTTAAGTAQSPSPASPAPVITPASPAPVVTPASPAPVVTPASPVPVITPAPAVPQASPAPQGSPSRLALRLQKHLDVSPQLAARLESVIEGWLRTLSLPHVQEFRQKMQAIYTAEQAAMLEKWRNERRTLGPRAPRHRAAELRLTRTQVQEIEAARGAAEKVMRADRGQLLVETRSMLSPAQQSRLQKMMRFHDREAWRSGRSPWFAAEGPGAAPVQSPQPTPDGTQGP